MQYAVCNDRATVCSCLQRSVRAPSMVLDHAYSACKLLKRMAIGRHKVPLQNTPHNHPIII